MPIYFEGLCGIVYKASNGGGINQGIYVLLPDATHTQTSTTDPPRKLPRHYPRVLIEYGKLNAGDQALLTKVMVDTTECGLIDLDNGDIQIEIAAGEPNIDLAATAARQGFIEMEKVHFNNNPLVGIHQNLLNGNIAAPINTPAGDVKLINRVYINKGTLSGAAQSAGHYYNFPGHTNPGDPYPNTNRHQFYSQFVVTASINAITANGHKYDLSAHPDATIYIQHLPLIEPSIGEAEPDIDFELTYNLVPGKLKRLPINHSGPHLAGSSEGSYGEVQKEEKREKEEKAFFFFRPAVCSLAWFPDIA